MSECGSARARVAGDPRGPRRREARAGEGSSLWALRGRASSSTGVQLPTARREAKEPPATLVHSTRQSWAPGERFCCGRLGGREGKQGRPHTNLGTCSQSARRSSPRESRRGLGLRREKAPPARGCPPWRWAEADPAVPRRRRGARPPAPRAHGGCKARIGGRLATGTPAEARAAVRGAETTLSARSRASGAAEESIIQISATASSPHPHPQCLAPGTAIPPPRTGAPPHTHTTESAPALLPVPRHPRL